MKPLLARRHALVALSACQPFGRRACLPTTFSYTHTQGMNSAILNEYICRCLLFETPHCLRQFAGVLFVVDASFAAYGSKARIHHKRMGEPPYVECRFIEHRS